MTKCSVFCCCGCYWLAPACITYVPERPTKVKLYSSPKEAPQQPGQLWGAEGVTSSLEEHRRVGVFAVCFSCGQHLPSGSPSLSASLSDPRVQELLKDPTCLLPSATELKQGTHQPPFPHLSGRVHPSSDSSYPSSPPLVCLVAVVRVTVGGPFASRGVNVSQQEIASSCGAHLSLTDCKPVPGGLSSKAQGHTSRLGQSRVWVLGCLRTLCHFIHCLGTNGSGI